MWWVRKPISENLEEVIFSKQRWIERGKVILVARKVRTMSPKRGREMWIEQIAREGGSSVEINLER